MFRHMLLLKHRGGTTHSKSLLNSLVTDTIWETNASQHFTELIDPPRFKIPQLNIRVKPMDVQMIAGFDDQRQLSIPLIILSVVKESDNAKLAWSEAPKALLLAATAYSRNLHLEYYDGFGVCLDGPCVRYRLPLPKYQQYSRNLKCNQTRKNDTGQTITPVKNASSNS